MNVFYGLVLYMAIGGIFLGGLHATDSENKDDINTQAFVVVAWPSILVSAIVVRGEKGDD